jgi:hypothetical protein
MPMTLSTVWNTIPQETAETLTRQFSDKLLHLYKSYTDGNSTSIRIETAEDLYAAMHYTLNYYLQTKPNEHAAALELQIRPFDEIYDDASKSIKSLKNKIINFYSLIIQTRIPTDHFDYNMTIDIELKNNINKFNDLYFLPQESILFSYRLCREAVPSEGIVSFFGYCKNMVTENNLCHRFMGSEAQRFFIGVDGHENLFGVCLNEWVKNNGGFDFSNREEAEKTAHAMADKAKEFFTLSDFNAAYTGAAIKKICMERYAQWNLLASLN